MPAYHLLARRWAGGVTLVNIGVGPSNAKNITDHLAVLRPHCWLMVGHCGGLRQSQAIGDYVLAHAYLRRDGILDELVPPDMPIPALAEVQVALQEAAAQVTGERGDALKQRLRTGTVVTYDDRNWELRWSQERRRINLSRAIAVDMESGTIAAQGYRLRVPYGTLLCVSDKPLHGEIKLPGAANAFYERAVGEHLRSASPRWTCCAASSTRCTRASCAASTSRRSAEQDAAVGHTAGRFVLIIDLRRRLSEIDGRVGARMAEEAAYRMSETTSKSHMATLTLLRLSFPRKREPRCRHTVMPALGARLSRA